MSLNTTEELSSWDNKRYYSLDYYLKKTYGYKVYKLSLNGGMTCPNRDGKLDTRGCLFCSEGGSGEFSSSCLKPIYEQIEDAKRLVSSKLVASNTGVPNYIAYFQAYTNTYAPVDYLRKIFMEAILHPDILILSIATRPDCINEDIIALLKELNHIKPVWIELGLQTTHQVTANFIRRGYSLDIFEKSVYQLRAQGINIITHMILGLPKETKHDMLSSMEYLGSLPIQGIKLQLLHILKGTDLGLLFEQGSLQTFLTLEAYMDLVISCLEILPQDMVIHRVTGDGPKELLLAPLWSLNKKNVLNSLHKEMKSRDTWQGKYYIK